MNQSKRTIPVHYLRPNHISWTPPSLLSFDTETVSHADGDNEVMTLRLWCAMFTDRRTPKGVKPIQAEDHGTLSEDLASFVHHYAKQRRTVWAYAHNLGFDLCTSRLAETLVDIGWVVNEFAVNAASPFVRLSHGDSRLTLADSWSWTGARLEDVGEAIGVPKPPLPGWHAPETDWQERCRADTLILHTSMLQLMEWWDDNDLGNWSITGGASGFNCMRHIPAAQKILIRPDPGECEDDRKAVYGGRRNTWVNGKAPDQGYIELDIVKAYTSVCAHFPLPLARQASFASLPRDHRWLESDRHGVIAECAIRTDAANYPCRIGGSVWYPVGVFRTTLASPDILAARDAGTLEWIGAGWLHLTGYALRPWAQWCLSRLADDAESTPDLAKLVLKSWARSCIGKWNQRGFETVQLGASPNDGWHHEEAWHHAGNTPASIVDFAGTRYQVAAVGASENAYPAILAFVESYVRVGLGRCIDVIGPEHMVACDTDGFICPADRADRVDEINELIHPLRVRVKRRYNNVRVLGPQYLELDNTRRRAGIPSGAIMGPDGKLHANLWPKLAWQLENGRLGTYVRPSQSYLIAPTYAPGWVLSDGTVVPVEAEIGPAGDNLIVPWPRTRYALKGAVLADGQNQRLERYRDE